MNPEERIAWVLAVLSKAGEPLSFDEVVVRSSWSSNGGVAFALGALTARNKIGCLEDKSFVAKKGRVYSNAADLFWAKTIIKALAGPATFWELMLRIEMFDPVEIGFVLGWLYANGVVEFVCRSGPGYPQWRLVGRQE